MSLTDNQKFSKGLPSKRGFTLIELLVVISIIGLLASVVLVSLNSARAKSRDTKRRADLKQLQTALELYYDANNVYPSTGGTAAFRGLCDSYNDGCGGGSNSCTQTGATGYIPGLAPSFVTQLPKDPKQADPDKCYLYTSNGSEYKLIAYQTMEGPITSSDPMYDPYPTYPRTTSIAVFSSGGSAY